MIGIDATPLTPHSGGFGGHAVRGIGRYVRGVLTALAAHEPDWAAGHVLPVRTIDVDMVWWPGETVVTRRARTRPQDVGWWTSPPLDWVALAGKNLDAWTTTDPNSPLGPPRAGHSIVVAYDLIPLNDQRAMDAIAPHRQLVYRAYLRRLERAELVIAISHTVADELRQRLRVSAGRIAVVYPGLQAAAESEPADAARADPDLLFVGVPAAHKNPHSAIGALAEIRRRGRPIRLRYAGTHPDGARAALESHAGHAGVAGAVDFLGQVDDATLTGLYRSSILLSPSTIEGLGLTPIEALLSGGRAICGPAPVFRETLGDLVAYADPGNAPATADAYERLAARPPARPAVELVERFAPATSAAAARSAFDRVLRR